MHIDIVPNRNFIVSDHGMTPVSEERVIYLDDYMDLANVNVVGSGSGAPIWPQPGDEDDVYASLATAHPNMSVFKKEDIPERFHYRKHPRIPPILAIAHNGWTIRARESSRPIEGGAHGYDNRLPNMQAAFVAHGPAFKKGVIVESFRNIQHLQPSNAQPGARARAQRRKPGSGRALAGHGRATRVVYNPKKGVLEFLDFVDITNLTEPDAYYTREITIVFKDDDHVQITFTGPTTARKLQRLNL